MSDSVSDLELLRRRIDEIDDRLQDLLIERAEIVASVGAHKRGRVALPAHQPWREAEIIRRLVRRGKGAFPAATLVRMWRELLAATVRMQSSFTVAVYSPPNTRPISAAAASSRSCRSWAWPARLSPPPSMPTARTR